MIHMLVGADVAELHVAGATVLGSDQVGVGTFIVVLTLFNVFSLWEPARLTNQPA
jgi:hypothetical protein